MHRTSRSRRYNSTTGPFLRNGLSGAGLAIEMRIPAHSRRSISARVAFSPICVALGKTSPCADCRDSDLLCPLRVRAAVTHLVGVLRGNRVQK